jgi:BirA family biotin operon repressor/biotin-[acetyl-CoA-carboxylase] ligase
MDPRPQERWTADAAAPLSIDAIRAGLTDLRFARKIHYFARIDSTNVYARRRAEEGAPEGEVVIADEQTHGKGRLGRPWVSPPRANVYLSLILRPELAPTQVSQLTFTAAVALAETVQSFAGASPEIKWPNDILIDGKKLAGILSECSVQSGRVLYAILGIGVNLNYSKALMPEEIRNRATSLMAVLDRSVDRNLFAGLLIRSLERCYLDLSTAGFGPMALRWEGFFKLNGKRVRVEMVDQTVHGIVRGVDPEGALLVEDHSGLTRRVVAGDVIPAEC